MQVGPQLTGRDLVLGVVAAGPGKCQAVMRNSGLALVNLLAEVMKMCLALLVGQAAELEKFQLVMKHSGLVLESLPAEAFVTHLTLPACSDSSLLGS